MGLLILSLADANWATWCPHLPDWPECANVDSGGPISGVPDFCDPLPDDIERCMVACTPDITKCDWTGKWDEFKGNWEDACKAIPTENWKYIDQCKNGGKDYVPVDDDEVGKKKDDGITPGDASEEEKKKDAGITNEEVKKKDNAAPSAGGLVMMATM